jgi:large subunit ribosomal protein L22
MEIRATHKYARISALKARDVAREVTGLPVSDALDVIRFTPKKAAYLIGKTLKSAIANAEANHDISADTLVVKSATVNEGPALKRWSAAARGGASPIRKRTSHIYVVLTDEGGEASSGREAAQGAKPVKKKVAKSAPAAGTIDDPKLGAVYTSAPENADDLKAIQGLGKKIEGELHGIGIYTFAQISAWTEEQIAEIDERLGLKGRIVRENWVGQAAELAAK